MNITPKNQYVVLLHGLGRGSHVMRKIEKHLRRLGYEVYNESYLSTTFVIEELAERIYKRVQQQCKDQTKALNFVTFSMGGIVLRYLINQFHPNNLARVVMIAPPNKGTEVADFIQRIPFVRKFYGPAAGQIGVGENSIVHSLGDINYELGIIAGDRTIDFFFSKFILPSKGDGKVTIESTKHPSMQDHIIVRASHPYITRKKNVREQIAHFLEHGKFKTK